MQVVKTSFEQVPIELVRRIAVPQQSLAADGFACCAVCGDTVELERCKTDEHGQAVHQKCYVARLAKIAKKQSAKPRE
jgi:hypothetical protein